MTLVRCILEIPNLVLFSNNEDPGVMQHNSTSNFANNEDPDEMQHNALTCRFLGRLM